MNVLTQQRNEYVVVELSYKGHGAFEWDKREMTDVLPTIVQPIETTKVNASPANKIVGFLLYINEGYIKSIHQ